MSYRRTFIPLVYLLVKVPCFYSLRTKILLLTNLITSMSSRFCSWRPLETQGDCRVICQLYRPLVGIYVYVCMCFHYNVEHLLADKWMVVLLLSKKKRNEVGNGTSGQCFNASYTRIESNKCDQFGGAVFQCAIMGKVLCDVQHCSVLSIMELTTTKVLSICVCMCVWFSSTVQTDLAVHFQSFNEIRIAPIELLLIKIRCTETC